MWKPGIALKNIHLQAIAMNLETVVIGAFHDNQANQILNLADNEIPLYIIQVGKLKD